MDDVFAIARRAGVSRATVYAFRAFRVKPSTAAKLKKAGAKRTYIFLRPKFLNDETI
jgi:hypothetical protein